MGHPVDIDIRYGNIGRYTIVDIPLKLKRKFFAIIMLRIFSYSSRQNSVLRRFWAAIRAKILGQEDSKLQVKSCGARYEYEKEISPLDLTALVNDSQSHGAKALITTAKDAVKLRTAEIDMRCLVFDIQIAIDQEDQLTTIIFHAMQKQTAK